MSRSRGCSCSGVWGQGAQREHQSWGSSHFSHGLQCPMPVLWWAGSAKAQCAREETALTSYIESGLPSAHPETQHCLNLCLLLCHQARACESRGVLAVITVRLSASVACAFLYSSGTVKGKSQRKSYQCALTLWDCS